MSIIIIESMVAKYYWYIPRNSWGHLNWEDVRSVMSEFVTVCYFFQYWRGYPRVCTGLRLVLSVTKSESGLFNEVWDVEIYCLFIVIPIEVDAQEYLVTPTDYHVEFFQKMLDEVQRICFVYVFDSKVIYD